MSDLINMNGIEKRFPGVHALKDMRFELRAGEVHALMGENGAGKSTLMKILSGVYTRDSGSITLSGKPVEFSGPKEAQDAGVGIIHQELSLMNDLTAAQNIFIGREPRGRFGLLDEGKLNQQAADIFAKMQLVLDPTTPVRELSIAKQQMVEIAKALSYESRVLVMDEPTAALNDKEIGELFKIIEQLRADGVGVIYISHKMDEIKRISDRVTVLRDGEYVGTRESKETTIQEIIAMMVGRDLELEELHVPDVSQAAVALEVAGLNRGRAVRDVSFHVKKGEILGFAGLMGAGRTEVARVIFGADRLESGEIRVNGAPIDIRSPSDAAKAGIGYLSEDRKHFGLFLGMDVRSNIAMAAIDQFTGFGGVLDEAGMAAAAESYIKQIGIRTPSDRQEAQYLSGGNQQKIVIAKWLLRDCDVLIFDEPTRGVDVGAKSEIYKILNELAAKGKAIIVISSELPEILRVSHRIAVMCEGHLTGILGPQSTQEEIMQLATKTMQSPEPKSSGAAA
ncbi:sugar ABC transporter ATP-binding protein [Planktotalea sp.]|uniref:sugar ABC transporter ATP-binding protein n=1 Tax=Planktotalea sp. TaxID=2029877 RepID=UPI003297BFB6